MLARRRLKLGCVCVCVRGARAWRAQTIFVRSQKNFIYRSGDEGRKWERQNWKMEKTSEEEKSGILSFHVMPADTSKIFFRGVGKQHWHTVDRGLKYIPLDPAFIIKEVKPHPTEPEWMLASHLTEGCRTTARKDCSMEVYLTQDLGKTWKLLQRYVAQFEWAPAADGVLKPGMTAHSIFMVTYDMASGNQPFGVWSAKAIFSRSDDLWKSSYTLLPRGNRFLFLDKFIFVAVVNRHHENQARPPPLSSSSPSHSPSPSPSPSPSSSSSPLPLPSPSPISSPTPSQTPSPHPNPGHKLEALPCPACSRPAGRRTWRLWRLLQPHARL